jgi:hypothetical protein
MSVFEMPTKKNLENCLIIFFISSISVESITKKKDNDKWGKLLTFDGKSATFFLARFKGRREDD